MYNTVVANGLMQDGKKASGEMFFPYFEKITSV